MAIRLPIARVLTEIGRMAARKPTINKPKLNQPLDEDRFHEMQMQLSLDAIGRTLGYRQDK